MKITILFFTLFLTITLNAQNKEEYLSHHKSTLDANYTLPEKKAAIIGFGAYHGAAKTEEAEIFLLQSAINRQGVSYYFAETDISISHYFNEYLKTGDEVLLKDLVIHYGNRVPQERTLNVFEKWKKIKGINDKLPKNKKITVLGSDIVVTYKYTYKHLLSLIKDTKNWASAQGLQNTVVLDTTDYSAKYNSFTKQQLSGFIVDYEANTSKYAGLIKDLKMFNYIISGIKTRQQPEFNREKEMYSNYLRLHEMYNLKGKTQFFRLGFFHVMKHKEGNAASFFSMLIDNKIYPKNKIVTVMGYFTKSEVLWEDVFDSNGNYLRSETEGDFGIGDADNEYFKGIDKLKKEALNDMTIFKVNDKDSPYATAGNTDLIEIVYSPPQITQYGTATTIDFIDYAILMRNSAASTSIYTVKP